MSYNRYGDYDVEEEDIEEEVEEGLDALPRPVAELAQASTPANLKALRACKRCGIIKTVEQFMNDGCENCPMLDMVSLANGYMDVMNGRRWKPAVVDLLVFYPPRVAL